MIILYSQNNILSFNSFTGQFIKILILLGIGGTEICRLGRRVMHTYSFKIQVNEPYLHDKKYNSGKEISGNSHESHEKSVNKPARAVLHEGHAKNHEPYSGENSSHEPHREGEPENNEQHEEMNQKNHKQHEEMKDKQHEKMGHRQHEGMKDKQHEEMKDKQHEKMGHKQHEGMKDKQHEEIKDKQHEEMGHKQHEEMKHDGHEKHEGMGHKGHAPSGEKKHGNHHAHMLADFRKRFIVSVVLTVPVLLLSPIIQSFFHFELRVPGADFLTFLFSSIVYFYGGYPFLKGIKDELAEKSPGMMTLIAIAISVAYFYSSAVVFGLQ
jgi:Cu2+-exporting ATPase